MIPLPTVPTDNLYKFIAIAGLVLVGIGIVTPFLLDQGFFDYMTKRMQQENDRLVENYFKMRDDRDGTKESNDEFETLFTATKESQVAALKNELDAHRRLGYWKMGAAMVGLVLGVLLMGYGFWQWYLKIQLLLDEKLELELKLARADLNKAIAAAGQPKEVGAPS